MPRVPPKPLAALACGAIVAAVLAVRVAPLEPSLEVLTIENPMPGDAAAHLVEVKVRGGETLTRVAAEPASPGVRVLNPSIFEPVPPEKGVRFTVLVDGSAPRPRKILLRQEGRVSRTYDIVLSAESP